MSGILASLARWLGGAEAPADRSRECHGPVQRIALVTRDRESIDDSSCGIAAALERLGYLDPPPVSS